MDGVRVGEVEVGVEGGGGYDCVQLLCLHSGRQDEKHTHKKRQLRWWMCTKEEAAEKNVEQMSAPCELSSRPPTAEASTQRQRLKDERNKQKRKNESRKKSVTQPGSVRYFFIFNIQNPDKMEVKHL